MRRRGTDRIAETTQIHSAIPILFTPVPRLALYGEYRGYLFDEMGFDLQHLNGKLFPFLEFNRRRFPELTMSGWRQRSSKSVRKKLAGVKKPLLVCGR